MDIEQIFPAAVLNARGKPDASALVDMALCYLHQFDRTRAEDIAARYVAWKDGQPFPRDAIATGGVVAFSTRA
ncbi:hypothetical protein BJ123_12663 [Rhodopseudomonas thermotolerans]|uniref:Uncharacterized protein n=2 Tax=Rhodopseudomonas TaxID=1073 RepID=A0A336JT05_9BRAD|nr:MULTISPECIES: hypothetical protein [Rhodopseudomonas]RED27646.1 hypothetical protein BJ125_12663 [Rhodopseudomonas pentothenatexigens]REF91184.1 hypothetical protein BJ123_12663 [Rhodopseudomonas thermotolerans]SSW92917.1 hypothetical protein SAMN05892882_12663 [Rhodopseudomonas pentothenatexigens]